eukprot:XP_014790097.1 PREDICTED: proto-oncogene tyrosine-protein kinase receptor Ret-like isoform X1 [Octopus bimaculoides]
MGPVQQGYSSHSANVQLKHKIIEHDQVLTIQLQLHISNTSTSKATEYCVHWFLNSCNAYPDLEFCDIPPDHYGPKPFLTNVKTPELNLTNIKYNSKYTIRLEWNAKPAIDINVITPKCLTPDVTITYCEHRVLPLPPIGEIQWFLNNASLVYNISIGKVMANISWVAPFNKLNVKYSVTWQGPEVSETFDRIVAGKLVTSLNYVVLKLDIGFVYKIRVKAICCTDQSSNETLDSEFLYLNLTRGTYASEEELNGAKSPDDIIDNTQSGPKKVSSAAILAACASIFVLMAVLLLLIYKKRKSLKEVVIIKTMAAKNNTYKSNVTGSSKMDYTSEQTVVTDEWELDPSLLRFSTPLGQGAFGKVVTGYYAQRKVAIKVVKDSAPLSYKEDLLDELNLMKRIGIHPNIVSMVGACTQKEPIALVMEYVPYGNLHNFLRKCRSEGEVRLRNGTSELNYSVMDKNGQIENGIITPVDILSFARQISMAMEYMAENKYVHRDLAARNVLLDCGKVVKVCDFGLSRDIYKDNQYQKLTNGKLPIKWMAIESLRDRIFTTQSDVWSFGILLWEIVSLGASPYPSIALADLYHVLCSGHRMEKTSNCSEELYRIMRLCWAENPQKRPTFTQLRHLLEYLLSKDCNYLELDNINVPLAASENSSPPQSFEIDLAPPLPERRQIPEIPADTSPEELSTEFLIRRVYSQ